MTPKHGSEVSVPNCSVDLSIHGAVCGSEVADRFLIAPFFSQSDPFVTYSLNHVLIDPKIATHIYICLAATSSGLSGERGSQRRGLLTYCLKAKLLPNEA